MYGIYIYLYTYIYTYIYIYIHSWYSKCVAKHSISVPNTSHPTNLLLRSCCISVPKPLNPPKFTFGGPEHFGAKSSWGGFNNHRWGLLLFFD